MKNVSVSVEFESHTNISWYTKVRRASPLADLISGLKYLTESIYAR
jgi:hypothetical protein